jgi:hypothetical protein
MRQDSSYFDLKESARPAGRATDDVGCGTAGEGFRMGVDEHGFVEFAAATAQTVHERKPGHHLECAASARDRASHLRLGRSAAAMWRR